MATPAVPADQPRAAHIPAEVAAPHARGGRRQLTPYLLLGPSIAFLALFFAWPMVQSLILAFQDSSGVWSMAPVDRIVNHLRFGESVCNSVVVPGVVIALRNPAALILPMPLDPQVTSAAMFL